MFSRRAYCLACSVIVSLVLLPAPPVESVAVKAADFDHIEVNVPDEVMAGGEFEVVVSFFDRSGKLLPEEWEPSKTLSLVISNPGSVFPSVLTPENFHQNFRFLVSTYRTGFLDMSLMDKDGLVLKKWKLNVIPRRPLNNVIQNPDRAVSNERGGVSSLISTTDGGGGKTKEQAEGKDNNRPGILDAVEVNESGNRGVVSFSTNGIVEYDISTSAKFSRKWIHIVLPKVTPDLPEHLEGGENIIGDVQVEKRGNKGGVKISVEILPLRISYELFQQDDSLILKVTRQ